MNGRASSTSLTFLQKFIRHPSVAALALGVITAGCASSTASSGSPAFGPGAVAPTPDPRIGLAPGLAGAGEAIWNLRALSHTLPPQEFVGFTNSDLAFTGNYAVQGNYNGILIWDISNPAAPVLARGLVCPASQNDVSVYRNLLFVSAEGGEGRVDCGTERIAESIREPSPNRFRGVRIFDISDIRNPRLVSNVQTCRGSHTHTVVADPSDNNNVYVYVSGSYVVRPPEELSGCSGGPPGEDPNTALFRIEVIRVPLARPEEAAIVSSPRIFNDLASPGLSAPQQLDLEAARARGAFVVDIYGEPYILSQGEVTGLLREVMAARGGTGAPTAADSLALRAALPGIVAELYPPEEAPDGPPPGPTQCHDITVYPEIGLAGGACEGYGLLIDIRNPVNPVRIDAVADANFSYWHSATFNNDGTKVLFSDEWGGGGGAKCLATDPLEWGANAIFAIENRQMAFQGYYKMPAPQTASENCVAHNGSLIPIPGRDVMVQAWYQGGISVFDFTDAANPFEIAFFDRGPVNPSRIQSGGPWSTYWYNGVIVSSEIARGLDILELTPSPFLSQNEIDAAKTVIVDQFNPQHQERLVWPPSFALARAYLDQVERTRGLSLGRISQVREQLISAENQSGAGRAEVLRTLSREMAEEAGRSGDAARVGILAEALEELASSN